MCGRYYVVDETAKEIAKLVSQSEGKLRRESVPAVGMFPARDIHPADMAPVLAKKEGGLCCQWQRWGFPGFKGKQIIFNARSESVTEKPLFRDSVRHRRVAVPAASFYEWNPRKEKSTFYREGQPVLFMAGFYSRYEDGSRFVILTTAANASMKPVHDRMPLVLERDEAAGWVLDDERTEAILHKVPCLLERRTEYEQITLF